MSSKVTEQLNKLAEQIADLQVYLNVPTPKAGEIESRLQQEDLQLSIGQMRAALIPHDKFPMLMRAQTGLGIMEDHCGVRGAALGAEVLSLKIGMALEIVQFWVNQSLLYEFDPSAVDPSAVDPSAVDPSAVDPSVVDPSVVDPSVVAPSAAAPSAAAP